MRDPEAPADPDDRTTDDDLLDAGLARYFESTSSRELEVSDPPPMPERIGDYRILRRIGGGAMGDVYLAEETKLDRRVALKILKPGLCTNLDAVTRFRVEASSVARLKHPGIVQVFAVGESEGRHYIAMELVEGSPLQEVIAQLRAEGLPALDGSRVGRAVSSATHKVSRDTEVDRVDAAEVSRPSAEWDLSYIDTVCRLVAHIADGLQHAHEAGVIHRDVKPSNILVLEDGTAVLTDFGLARADNLPSVTKRDMYIGTPHYSSPEQAQAKKDAIDHRTDIFSLGVTLYELLTLRLPFEGNTSVEVLDKIREIDPPNPRRLNRKVPRDLVTILLKALEKDREHRYAAAGEFAADLRAVLAMEPISARRASLGARALKMVRRHPVATAATVVVAIALGIGAWVLSGLQGIAAFPSTWTNHAIYVDGTRVSPDQGGFLSLDPGRYEVLVVHSEGFGFAGPFPLSIERGETTPVTSDFEDAWMRLERADDENLDWLNPLPREFRVRLGQKLRGERSLYLLPLAAARFDTVKARIGQLETLLGERETEWTDGLAIAQQLHEDTNSTVTRIEARIQQLETDGLRRDLQALRKILTDLETLQEKLEREWRTIDGKSRFTFGVDRATDLLKKIRATVERIASRTFAAQSLPPQTGQDRTRWLQEDLPDLVAAVVALRVIGHEHEQLEPRRSAVFRLLSECADRENERKSTTGIAAIVAEMGRAEAAFEVADRKETRHAERLLEKSRHRDLVDRIFETTALALALEDLDGLPSEDELRELTFQQRGQIDMVRKILADCARLRSLCSAEEFAKARQLLAWLRGQEVAPRFEPQWKPLLDGLERHLVETEQCCSTWLIWTARRYLQESALADARSTVGRLREIGVEEFRTAIQRIADDVREATEHHAELDAIAATRDAMARLLEGLGNDDDSLARLHTTFRAACEEDLRFALKSNLRTDETRLRIARLHMRLGDFEAAIKAATPIENAAVANLVIGQAKYCRWMAKPSSPIVEAITHFRIALRHPSEKDKARARYWLGICQLHLLPEGDRTDEASQKILAEALPNLQAARERLGYVHAKHQIATIWLDWMPRRDHRWLENARDATDAIGQPLDLSEDEVFGISGGYERALAARSARLLLIKVYVSRAHALVRLGLLGKRTEEDPEKSFRECVSCCDKAIELDVKLGAAYYLRALSKWKLNEDARGDIEKALEYGTQPFPRTDAELLKAKIGRDARKKS